MFDDLFVLLGSQFESYPFLVLVVTCILFSMLVNSAFSLIRDVLEHVAGYR